MTTNRAYHVPECGENDLVIWNPVKKEIFVNWTITSNKRSFIFRDVAVLEREFLAVIGSRKVAKLSECITSVRHQAARGQQCLPSFMILHQISHP